MPGHPHFSSALSWRVQLDDATAAAQAEGKRIMLVVGRATCNGTRALVERTLSKEELEEFTPAKFVLLAADADAPEPRVAELVASLAVRAPTPLIVYLSPDGRRVLGATAGGRPPAVLLNDMLGATSKA